MKKLMLLSFLVLCPFLTGCGAPNIIPACEAYREAVGPEVIEYVNQDGVVTEPEAAILKADTDFQAEIKAGPTVANAETYRAKVGKPWLAWVDADAKLDDKKKKRRHNTDEDFGRALEAVRTGK
jgi:hypothetical protein